MTLAVYVTNQIFLEGFSMVDPTTTRKYTFQAFSSVLLTHYRCLERHIHKEMKEIYTALRHLILPVTLAPPTGFHASKRRDIGLRALKNLSSLASYFNHPINYCFQILENISLAICFLSCVSVNACRSDRARVSASGARVARCCSRELATL